MRNGSAFSTSGLDVGDVDEPRLAGDEVGDQQVQVPQVDREGEPVQEPPDRDPAATVAVALDVRPVRRLVLDLGLFGVDDHVLAVTRRVVDGGMADHERRRLRRLRDGAGEEVRRVARVGDVAGGGDHAVAVRVLQVRVHPDLLGEPARVEGAHADEDRRGLAVDRVAVDGERVHLVVALDDLQLLEGRHRDRRVPQQHVRERLLVLGEDRRREVLVRREAVTRHVSDPHRVAGRGDVVLDVRQLECALGGGDAQHLEDRRVDDPDDEGEEGPQPEGDRRQGERAAVDVDAERHEGQERDHGEQRRCAARRTWTSVYEAPCTTPDDDRSSP